MPQVNGSFQGQTLILPGVYYADNVQAAQPTTPPPTPPLIFVGYGYGGKPLEPKTFSDPQSLLNAIRGGPASGFVPFLSDPSGQVAGAQQITFINVGENTQSHLNILSGSAVPIGTLTSTNYGVPSNLLQFGVAAGTIAGKKVTLFDSFANITAVGDNLGVPFQLAYLGSASGVTMQVDTSNLDATQFIITSPNSGESVNLQIGAGQYTTVEQIVQYLNGTGFYSAITVGDGTLPATWLDAATGVALNAPASGVDQYVNVTASLGSVVYWVNQYASTLATMAVSGSVTQLTAALAPANIPLSSFTGATSVPPTNQDYANGFNVALTVPGWAVFADSNAPAVQALGQQHVATASEASNGKWRRFFTGSSIGDSIATTITNAQALDSNRCTYVYPGVFRTDDATGQNTLYGGLYGAAAEAGMATGNPPNMPLTNKALLGNGVEVNLTTAQINQLQQAGVSCLMVPDQTGVPTVVSDLTTWQQDNNPENVFNQQIACRDFLAYSLVNALRPYVGTVAAPTTLTTVRNAIKTTLNALVFTPGGNGVIATWDPNSLSLTYNGTTQTLSIAVSVTLVGQNRFITVFVPIAPLNLTLSSAQLSAVA